MPLPLTLALSTATPPYTRLVRLPPAPGAAAPLPRGTILVADVLSPTDADLVRAETVIELRRRHPTAPLVLRVPEITRETVRLSLRAARFGVRGVVASGDPLADTLRAMLSEPENLGSDLVEWLSLRGSTLPPEVALHAAEIVRLAPGFAHLRDLLSSLSLPERTVRHRFHRTGVPDPRAWHRAGRALRGALRLQADPGARVLDVAVSLGFADVSGLARQLSRAFGVTPAGVRGTLGWEWLAERWRSRSEPAGAAAK